MDSGGNALPSLPHLENSARRGHSANAKHDSWVTCPRRAWLDAVGTALTVQQTYASFGHSNLDQHLWGRGDERDATGGIENR